MAETLAHELAHVLEEAQKQVEIDRLEPQYQAEGLRSGPANTPAEQFLQDYKYSSNSKWWVHP